MDFQQPYKRQAYLDFFRNTLLPEDFDLAEESITPGFETRHIKKVVKLGEVPSLDLPVFEVKHKSENDPRVTLSKEAFRMLASYGKQQALILFTSTAAANFRLSLITLDLKLDGKKVTKEYSNPRRYSFFLGPQCKAHTPRQYLTKRIADMDDLKSRFSIEVVNKEFYREIALLFTQLTGGTRKIGSRTYDEVGCLKLPQGQNDTIKKEFAVRLIGRLIFCWFLKKKTSKEAIPLIPEAILSMTAVDETKGVGGYYHSTLEPLFFEALNTPIDQRKKDYRKAPWNIIPFLNGGLFTPHDHDFYAVNDMGHSVHINTLKVPDDWVKQLLAIFETYNFTIDENTPVDVELSIEPEMLGRIFENLLAEINPETGETARKSTGSYYTPRPIVEYMVDESLKQYLITKTGIAEDKIASLLSYAEQDGSGFTENQTEALIDALHTVKIIDPACGSGAFPMGILQKILLMLQKLDPDSRRWLDKLLSGIPDPMYRKELKKKIKVPNYLHKLGIIRDCIFGVDIQPIAVEISKLRCFLSLIVDEAVEDTDENRGIEHLPNLEFKFVCANTLIGLPKTEAEESKVKGKKVAEYKGQGLIFEATDKIDQLKELRDRYLTSYGKEKQRIEQEFRAVQSEMFIHSLEWGGKYSQTTKLAQWNPFSDEPSLWFDPEWMYGTKEGFDIVIGNPPYKILTKNNTDTTLRNLYIKNYNSIKHSNSKNLFTIFVELGVKLNRNTGLLTLIVPEGLFQTRSYSDCVKVLNNSGSLKSIVTFTDYVFENAITGNLVFVFLKNQVAETQIYQFDSDYILNETQGGDDNSPLVAKMSSNGTLRLKEICTLFKGMVVNNRKSVVFDSPKEGKDIFLLGKSISKWSINKKFYTTYNKLKIVGGTKALNKHQHSPRILIRRTGNTLCCCLLENPALSESTLYSCWSNSSNISVKYILSLLNSKLLDFYVKNSMITNKQGFPQILMTDLEELPIKLVGAIEQKLFVDLVDKILSAKQQNPATDITKWENQIDQMVYKLYGLTDDEVAIVEGQTK